MLTLLDADDSDPFNTEALQAAEEIETVLAEIASKYDRQQWHAALAVYVASAIREARLEHGMPNATAEMLCLEIRQLAFSEEEAPHADTEATRSTTP